jgi:signal transduction histidine kinase
LLLLCLIVYLNGRRTVEAQLRNELERDVSSLTREVNAALSEREAGLITLAHTPSIHDYVQAHPGALVVFRSKSEATGSKRREAVTANASATSVAKSSQKEVAALPRTLRSEDEAAAPLPQDLRADVSAFLLNNQKSFNAIACLQPGEATPLFRAEIVRNKENNEASESAKIRFQTTGLPSNDGDIGSIGGAWRGLQDAPVRTLVTRGPDGAAIRYTVPVPIKVPNLLDGGEYDARGALVADLKFDSLFNEPANRLTAASAIASRNASGAQQPSPPPQRLVIALHNSGQIFYHTNDALRYQAVSSALPAFKAIATAMVDGGKGTQFYDAPDGTRRLAAYNQLGALDLSVAVSGNDMAALLDVSRAAKVNVALSLLFGVLTALLLSLLVDRTRRDSLQHVTKGAVAIAGGNLDQRILVSSSDDARVLADSVNAMSDRLREQLARESESRQFDSFMRISAMMTHDLKNAIASLSLLVSNMERQFHRAEFRADAMQSLTEATDKLRALVAKLSAPVESLSGEHKRPRPVDLVPLIKHVLAATAEPSRQFHDIETQLPLTLVAIVDAERIEKVFENLALNALEAMGAERGTLSVTGGTRNEKEIFVSVCDTGPGITTEFQREMLFRPFATTKRQGVGLGLYTCREIVRAHGGQIEVESEKGSGACFRVVLPSGQITPPDRKSSSPKITTASP